MSGVLPASHTFFSRLLAFPSLTPSAPITDSQIFFYNKPSNDWTQIPGKLTQISCGDVNRICE
jgi:hypothetical protein